MPTDNYLKNRKQYMKDWWQANPKKYLWHSTKKRAKNSNIEFTIVEDDYEIPEFCPVLGIKLSGVRNSHQNKNNAPSLDRRDNNKGYIPSNVKVISFQANQYKSNMSKAQIKALYEYVISS